MKIRILFWFNCMLVVKFNDQFGKILFNGYIDFLFYFFYDEGVLYMADIVEGSQFGCDEKVVYFYIYYGYFKQVVKVVCNMIVF